MEKSNMVRYKTLDFSKINAGGGAWECWQKNISGRRPNALSSPPPLKKRGGGMCGPMLL